MLSRQALIRWAFVAVALIFCGYGLAAQWDEITSALARMTWYALVGSLLAGLAGLTAMMLAWRALLAGFGSLLPVRPATKVMFLGQLGKYVPGSVWALIGQTELAKQYGVPRERGAAATLLAMATTLATGCAIAAVTLPLTSANATRHYWWLLLLAVPAIASLHPRVVTVVLDRALRLIRRPPLPGPVPLRAMVTAVGWTLLGWLLFGVHAWLLVKAADGSHTGLLPLSTGAYALAWSVGFLVIFAPGGLGAREAALVVALSPVLPAGGPLVVALASRVVLTVADVIMAGAGVLLVKGARPGPPDPSDMPPRPAHDRAG
jgi:glycosyltransferase 2 family protein